MRGCQAGDRAARKPGDVVAQIADELLIFRHRADVADFCAQPLRFAGHASNIVLQPVAKIDERLRDLLQGGVITLRFLIGRNGTCARSGFVAAF